MKNMLLIALAVFTSLSAFGQEKGITAPPAKTAQQIHEETTDFMTKQNLERIERYAGYFRDSATEFQKLAEKRTNAYKALDEALTDGDAVLVKKAVSDIHSANYAIKLHVEAETRDAKQLQDQIASSFQDDTIKKERYLELRNMVRSGMAEIAKELPAEYAKLVEKAKTVVPDYFVLLERVGRPFGQ